MSLDALGNGLSFLNNLLLGKLLLVANFWKLFEYEGDTGVIVLSIVPAIVPDSFLSSFLLIVKFIPLIDFYPDLEGVRHLEEVEKLLE